MKNILLKLYFGIIILAMLIYNTALFSVMCEIIQVCFSPFKPETLISAIPTIVQFILGFSIFNFYSVIAFKFLYDIIKGKKSNLFKVLMIFAYIPFIVILTLGIMALLFKEVVPLVD